MVLGSGFIYRNIISSLRETEWTAMDERLLELPDDQLRPFLDGFIRIEKWRRVRGPIISTAVAVAVIAASLIAGGILLIYAVPAAIGIGLLSYLLVFVATEPALRRLNREGEATLKALGTRQKGQS